MYLFIYPDPKDIARKVSTEFKSLYQQEHFGLLMLYTIWCKGTRKLLEGFMNMLYIREDLSGKEVFDDIFQTTQTLMECLCKNVFPKRVVIQGKPGMGKTTLSNKLCQEWADDTTNSPLKKFEHVWLVHLRMLDKKQHITHIVDLIEKLGVIQLSDNEMELLKEYVKDFPGSVCIILDGLDEVSQSMFDEILTCWNENSDVRIILTTRPEYGRRLKEKVSDGFYFTLTGFDKSMKEQFIKEYFGDGSDMAEKGRKLFIKDKKWSHLTSNPMSLTLLCILLAELKETLPDTNTQITHQTILTLIKRGILRSGVNIPLDIDSITQLPEEYLKDIIQLGKLANTLFIKERYTFKSNELSSDFKCFGIIHLGLFHTLKGIYINFNTDLFRSFQWHFGVNKE